MTIEEINRLLRGVGCPGYTFFAKEDASFGYLQAWYSEPLVVAGILESQVTQKWPLSPETTKAEIIQTALQCALASQEDYIRRHFRSGEIAGEAASIYASYAKEVFTEVCRHCAHYQIRPVLNRAEAWGAVIALAHRENVALAQMGSDYKAALANFIRNALEAYQGMIHEPQTRA